MKNSLLFAILIMVGGPLLFGVGRATAQENPQQHMQMQAPKTTQEIKAGKKGDIVLSETTQVGDITLKPGHYLLQHRVSDGQHFVKFTELEMSRGRHPDGATTGAKDAGEVKCTVQPLKEKVTQTAVYIDTAGGVRKVTRIEVAGENVTHVF